MACSLSGAQLRQLLPLADDREFFVKGEEIMKAKPTTLQLSNMELKYCERCGNIWLRRSGSERTLCAPCANAETALLLNRPDSFLQVWTRFRAEVQA
jgi:formylmethanofuran dehydrogenase subunit E